MKFSYSRNYYPPAPVARITLVAPTENLQVGPLTAFIDSGADATIVPLNHLAAVNAPETDPMAMRSQWGEERRVMLYLIDVQIGDVTLSDIEVVGDEISNEIILGRDVLNQLRLLLDGPDESVEILE